MFKATALVFSLFTSIAAYGGEYSIYQRIHFQEASTWVEADKTCIYGDYIYYQRKKSITVSFCEDESCENNVAQTLVQPIVSTRDFCTKPNENSCGEWTTVDYVQGPVVKVALYSSLHDSDNGTTPKKVLDYTIPQCVNLK